MLVTSMCLSLGYRPLLLPLSTFIRSFIKVKNTEFNVVNITLMSTAASFI